MVDKTLAPTIDMYALALAKAESGAGGKEVSSADIQRAKERIKNMKPEQVSRLISELESAGAAGKTGQFTGRRMKPSCLIIQ